MDFFVGEEITGGGDGSLGGSEREGFGEARAGSGRGGQEAAPPMTGPTSPEVQLDDGLLQAAGFFPGARPATLPSIAGSPPSELTGVDSSEGRSGGGEEAIDGDVDGDGDRDGGG